MLCDAHHYGEGHINDTFVVWREDHSKRFILQRINTDTFTNPVGLMENVCGVTRHLRAKILAEGGDPARETLNVIPTLSGSIYYLDADGGAWKLEAKKNIYNYLAEQLEGNIDSGEVVLLV